MDYLKMFPVFLIILMVSSSSAIQHRYGGGGGRFKRPSAPSFEGGQSYTYSQQPPSYSYIQPQIQPVNPVYSGRPFGLPEEKPRLLHNAFTYKLPDTDPPPPPVKHGYISRPYADYVVRFGSGNGGLTVVNRPPEVKQPPPANPIITSIYANDYVSPSAPSVPASQPEDIVNVHPPLTSVYVISASEKKEGAKEAFVGLHKEPVFGSSPNDGVIKPLTPNQVVYSPNQRPSAEQGEEFKPMYIFGPVFYPKDNSGSGSSNSGTVLKSSSNETETTTTTSAPSTTTTTASPSVTTTTTTTQAPSSSGSDSAAEDSKGVVPADETVSVSDESSSSSSSSKSGGKGGRRGIIRGIIKGLLGVEGSDDLDETNSRADEDADVEEDEIESDNSTSKVEDDEEEYETEEVERPKKVITTSTSPSTTRKSTSKKNRNQVSHRKSPSNKHKNRDGGNRKDNDDVSVVSAAEDKKETNINGNLAVNPQQSLEAGSQNSDNEDPDPVVGPLQIGFIGAPPQGGFPNQFVGTPMQPYFYPAGIPLYNRPPINPFSPTGTGFSSDQYGLEADHTQPHQQQQPSPQFTLEMIKHEEEKIRQNFNQQNTNTQSFANTAETVEATDDDQTVNKPEVSAHIEQGIAIDSKRETTVASVDHTDQYDDQTQTQTTTIADNEGVDLAEKETLDQKEDTLTAYADIKPDIPSSYYSDVAPASQQTSSVIHVEPTFNNNNNNYNNNGNENYNLKESFDNKGIYNGNFNENIEEEQTSTASISTRKPFPSYHQRYFRPKNRNYVAPTTYRPSYPRTPSAAIATEYVSPVSVDLVEDNQLDDQKDSSATLYNSIQYEPVAEHTTTSSAAVTPVIHVEPYGDRQLETANSETVESVAPVRNTPYGSRIQNNDNE